MDFTDLILFIIGWNLEKCNTYLMSYARR